MSASPPAQERVLRLERALAAAIQQERYVDAANLRDALAAARTSDPVLAARAALAAAVAAEDFGAAAARRDELAALTERVARGDVARRIDRIVVLRGRGDVSQALRVATVNRDGRLPLPLVPPVPPRDARDAQPRVYMQPSWSPSGDFVAMTEIAFNIDPARAARGLTVAETTSRIIVMDAFDGSVVKTAQLDKPPFFFYWSPDGRSVTLLSNDSSSPTASVALSVMQVVAPPGEFGLALDSVTGPIASGHPFLYDFCPRDSKRVIAHMGDSSSVAILRVDGIGRERTVLTTDGGLFGTPQWHPLAGQDGREVVLYVERDPDHIPKRRKKGTDENGNKVEKASITINGFEKGLDPLTINDAMDNDRDKDAGAVFEKFISNGSTLFESVLRKGAESLGLTDFKLGKNNQDPNDDLQLPFVHPLEEDEDEDEDEDEEDDDDEEDDGDATATNVTIEIHLDGEESVDALKDKLRGLLSKRIKSSDLKWGSSEDEEPIYSRLVMVDIDNPENRKVLTKFSGNMAFKLSPCGKHLATLITNPSTGQDELTISTGNYKPDAVVEEEQKHFSFLRNSTSNDADIVLSTPTTRVMAFFWSPDGKKLLFLTSLRGSKIGASQWATFDMESMKVTRYEKFVISGIYSHCLHFFDQFASSMTPWSPDSDAFCYPGRPLSTTELEQEKDQNVSSTSTLSALFIQRDGAEGKKFAARMQTVPCTAQGKTEPEEPTTIVDNVEYACWSPC